MSSPKLVQVAVGVVFRADGAVLFGERVAGKPYAGWWEFPGGKLEAGETVEQALARELSEELGLTVHDSSPWVMRDFIYPHASVRLHFQRVTAWSGEPQSREGQRFVWQQPDDISVGPMLPAALPVIEWLRLPRRMLRLQPGERLRLDAPGGRRVPELVLADARPVAGGRRSDGGLAIGIAGGVSGGIAGGVPGGIEDGDIGRLREWLQDLKHDLGQLADGAPRRLLLCSPHYEAVASAVDGRVLSREQAAATVAPERPPDAHDAPALPASPEHRAVDAGLGRAAGLAPALTGAWCSSAAELEHAAALGCGFAILGPDAAGEIVTLARATRVPLFAARAGAMPRGLHGIVEQQ